MEKVIDIASGLRIPVQIPLDAKAYSESESVLSDLGVSDNLAYTYYDSLIVSCRQERTNWEWREALEGESGLLGTNFVYPPNWIVYGVNYSMLPFNFFQVFTDFDSKLEKGDYSGNAGLLDDRIVALENQTDVENAFVTMQNFSLTGNVLTVYAGWVWKLLGITYTNPTGVNLTIPYCATGKTRIEYTVPNNTNGFTRIAGVETLGIPIAPQIPNDDMYVTFYIVTDGSVGTPQAPNTKKTPNLQQVTDVGYSTKNPIWFFNAANSKCIGVESERILFQKNESIFNALRADNTTESYTTQLPNKLGGAEQTLAMVSDLTKANVGLSNVDNTSDSSKPVSTAQQAALDLKLNTADYNQHFKGVYLTEAALIAAHPTASVGNYAQVNVVGETDAVNYNWDAEGNIWVVNAVAGSGALNTDELPEGSTNLYWTVARFLANLTYANVIAALGFTPSTAPNDAQKNSDITKAEIEAKLTGEISTHTHPAAAQNLDITILKIGTNTTLDNTYNGKVILLTASCTLTLPNGLALGFNYSVKTRAGVTLTYALGGSVVLMDNTGTTMAEKLSHTMANTGVLNEYLSVGNL